MFAGLQLSEHFKMFRAQRFGNNMFGIKPFAQVNELAALRTKRPKLAGKPVAGLVAGRTFRLPAFI